MEVEGNSGRNGAPVRRDCERAEAEGGYVQPIPELLVKAQTVPRGNFDPRRNRKPAQIKTGGCPEDCAYCAQSVHYDTGLKATRLTDRADVVAAAQRDKAAGASRFCMAAAWRSPKDRDLDKVCHMIAAVKRVGMETCVTLGMLTPKPHASPTPASTSTIITWTLHPRINLWNEVNGVPVKVTAERPDPIALVRLVATARIMMPKSVVRLAAGRQYMSDELQALCFLAGANSILVGDVLLTTKNPQFDGDASLLARLGITSGLA